MKEYVEFRIPEKNANRYLEPHEGKRLGNTVRALTVAVDDPRYDRIGDLNRELLKERGEYFFLGWIIYRRYKRPELEAAELFNLMITAVFEPPGEMCGTEYDDSTACPVCGAGRTQRSDLSLDLRRTPKGKDIARTIADEWIVSQRLAELLVEARMTGFELRPVHHKARYQDDLVYMHRVPTGRKLMWRAEAAGIHPDTWDFVVWLNSPGQKALAEQAWDEHAQLMERRDRRRPKDLPVWYQLVVTSSPVVAVSPTRFGIDPFDEDPDGDLRCPFGHVSGLNLLSELWVVRSTLDGSDVAQTENFIGARTGVLVPRPELLISPRLWRLLEAEKVKGYKVEVAHLWE